jgi:hypothetical protein
MSEQTPPNPFPLNPIFNYSDWISGVEYLTINMANALYLKKSGDSATGLINFNNGITVNNLCNISCNVLLNGVNGIDRQITASQLNLTNVNDNSNCLSLYSNINNVYYDNNVNNGSHIILCNNNSGIQTAPLQINSLDMTIQTINPPTSNATQPPFNDSSTKIPTTAWIQNAIINNTIQKTYTIQYTTTQLVTLPSNLCGISVLCVGKGGPSGNASNSSIVGLWNAGGSGSGGTTITNAGMLPFKDGIMQITINDNFSELYASTGGFIVCRSNAGGFGGNASFGAGGIAGVSNSSWIVNNGLGAWNVTLGSNGLNGGSNLSFQSSDIPITGGAVTACNWNPSTINGSGQNWNGFTTTNSYQGAAIPILSGSIWITYYLK